jgi:hypothetical protein
VKEGHREAEQEIQRKAAVVAEAEKFHQLLIERSKKLSERGRLPPGKGLHLAAQASKEHTTSSHAADNAAQSGSKLHKHEAHSHQHNQHQHHHHLPEIQQSLTASSSSEAKKLTQLMSHRRDRKQFGVSTGSSAATTGALSDSARKG